jgi:mRNA interferase MazF
VYRYRTPASRRGHEQGGTRFAVVVQSVRFEGLSTVVVVPTSTSARPTALRPSIEVAGERTLALAEQMGAVDRSRLGTPHGRVTPAELRKIDRALLTVLGLDR